MKYYQELTLLPQAEVSVYAIWPRLYTQLHLALVEIQNGLSEKNVGVSFPQYRYGENNAPSFIGSKLRIFSPDEATLTQLNLEKWLHRLHDYIHVTQVRVVPENIKRYYCFNRLQAKSNMSRLARRKAKRETISIEHALDFLDGFRERKLNQPFINLGSLSGGERFRLFIGRKEFSQPVQGAFNTYGLSSLATVPDF